MDAVAERVDPAAGDSAEGETSEDILREARERYDTGIDVDHDNRERQEEDTRFVWVKGAQWEKDAYDARSGWDQPCLEASQLTQFVKQVVNNQRQKRPGVLVSAASGDASKEMAEILQGMIRHIEVDSQAEAAYDSAYEQAVTGGRGWLRVTTEYEGPNSFNQLLKIKGVQDPRAVVADPFYREPDGSDMGWCFVVERMTRKAFEAAYPDADPLDWDAANEYGDWLDTKDGVLVADYYRRVKTPRTLVLMSDGAVGWKDTLPAVLPEGVTVERERQADDFRVEWFKVAGGQQILERLEWPGKTIPVVVVPGNEIWVDGKRQFQGLIRRARDTQMLYNYLISAAAERVALAPKAPWVMAEGQDDGYENLWKNANRTPNARLIYKPVTLGDQLAPPPMRQSPVAAEMGLLQHAEACKQDIKSILGMYESTLGQRGNETSGRAIMARQEQSDNATFDFVDNLGRAIAVVGRICVECTPTVYDSARVVGMVKPDGTKETTQINEPTMRVNPVTGALDALRNNDVAVGRFAVTVSVGPSYATKRAEQADSLLGFIQAFPPAAQVAGDLIAKTMDWADADVLAERLQYLLPPPIQQAEAAKKEGKNPPDPQLMAQLQQMQQAVQQSQQVIGQLQQALQQAQAAEAAKVAEAQAREQAKAVDAQEREATARAKIEADERLRTIELAANERLAEAKAAADAQAKINAKLVEVAGDLIAQSMVPRAAPGGEAGEEAGEAVLQSPPMDMTAMVAALQQTMEALSASLLAPRAMTVQTDAMGNVVGGTSQVVPTTIN